MGFLPYLLKQMAGEVPNPGTLETGEFFIKTCSVCRVLKINGNHVFQRIDKNPHLYHALIGALTQNYVNVLYLSTRITNQPAVIRICRMLLEFGMMENGRLSLPRHFNYYNIGTYTSLHVITVTKIFKALLKAGIISRKGHKIFVEKKKELEDITERQRNLHY
jgi:CRP-like cAMP-binding protein